MSDITKLQQIVELSEKIGYHEGLMAADEWLYLEPDVEKLKKDHIVEMKAERTLLVDRIGDELT